MRKYALVLLSALACLGAVVLFGFYDTLYLDVAGQKHDFGFSPLDWIFIPHALPYNYLRIRMVLLFILVLLTFIGLLYFTGRLVGLGIRTSALAASFVAVSGLLDVAMLKSVSIPYLWAAYGEGFLGRLGLWLPITVAAFVITMLLVRWWFWQLQCLGSINVRHLPGLRGARTALLGTAVLGISSLVTFIRYVLLVRAVHHVTFQGRVGTVLFAGPQPYNHLLPIAIALCVGSVIAFLVFLHLSGRAMNVRWRDTLTVAFVWMLPSVVAVSVNKSLSMYNYKRYVTLSTNGLVRQLESWTVSYDIWRTVAIASILLVVLLFSRLAVVSNAHVLQSK